MSSKAENCALSDPFANPLQPSPWENSPSIEKICKKESALALEICKTALSNILTYAVACSDINHQNNVQSR